MTTNARVIVKSCLANVLRYIKILHKLVDVTYLEIVWAYIASEGCKLFQAHTVHTSFMRMMLISDRPGISSSISLEEAFGEDSSYNR